MSRYDEALKRSEEGAEWSRLNPTRGGGYGPVRKIPDQPPIILPAELATPIGKFLLKRAQFYYEQISDERELIRNQAVIKAIGVENMLKFLTHMEEIHFIVDVFNLRRYSDQIDKLRGTAQSIYLSA